MLRLFVQSSSAIVVLAITFSLSGLITQPQAVLMTLGTGLGVAISSYLLAGNLRGVPRQIILFQVAINGLASLTALALFVVDFRTGIPLPFPFLRDAMEQWPGSVSNHIAITYLALNILSLLYSVAGSRFATGLLDRISPATAADDIASPQYLLDEVLEDPATALDLVEKEQQRLLGLIPHLLPSSRRKGHGNSRPEAASTHASLGRLAREIRVCLSDILDTGNTAPEAFEHVLRLERRQSHLEALEENAWRLVDMERNGEFPEALLQLEEQLVESLDAVFLVAIDAMASRDPLDIEILVGMTGDRGELMRAARAGFLAPGHAEGQNQRTVLLHMTSVFERLIWIMNQFAASLEAEGRTAPPNLQSPVDPSAG